MIVVLIKIVFFYPHGTQHHQVQNLPKLITRGVLTDIVYLQF